MTASSAERAGRLLVFAKAPVPGQVKTRLIPALGAQGAAQLHRRLVGRTLEIAIEPGVGPVELCCGSEPDHPFFLECARRYPLLLAAQGDGDLGERMQRAFERALDACDWAILIGSDIPALDAEYLRRAAMHLRSGCAAVLGPAEDGGYVLIGLRRPLPGLFRGMRWGSATVLAETRSRLDRLGCRAAELQALWDLDRPEDLPRIEGSFEWEGAAKSDGENR